MQRQWLAARYGLPVAFPPQSPENALLRRFSQREPPSARHCPSAVAVPVVMPGSKAKPASEFPHLGRRAQAALAQVIDDGINLCLWTELSSIAQLRLPLSTSIAAWCEAHGIHPDQADTIRQRFYRLRRSHGARRK